MSPNRVQFSFGKRFPELAARQSVAKSLVIKRQSLRFGELVEGWMLGECDEVEVDESTYGGWIINNVYKDVYKF